MAVIQQLMQCMQLLWQKQSYSKSEDGDKLWPEVHYPRTYCAIIINQGVVSIRMSSYQYRDSHVGVKTVSPTVSSLTWKTPYLERRFLYWDGALVIDKSDIKSSLYFYNRAHGLRRWFVIYFVVWCCSVWHWGKWAFLGYCLRTRKEFHQSIHNASYNASPVRAATIITTKQSTT